MFGYSADVARLYLLTLQGRRDRMFGEKNPSEILRPGTPVNVSPAGPPQVVARLNELEKVCGFLHESLEELTQRLGPVLRPTPPETTTTGRNDPEAPQAPIAQYVSELSSRVRVAAARVRHLADLVEV